MQERVSAQIHTTSLQNQFIHFKIPVHSNIYKTLDWHDEHEFRLNGQMYDIISSKVKNDIVYMTCFRDLDDTELISEWLTFLDLNDILKKVTQHIKKTIEVGFTGIIIDQLTHFFTRYDFCIIQLFPDLTIKQGNSGYNFFVFQPPEFH